MNEQHFAYLAEIGTTRVARDRAQTMWSIVHGLFGSELKEIFVNDYVTDEGVRTFSNIWFFTDEYFAECRDFIERTHFDRTDYLERIQWIDIEAISYDMGENTTDTSRLMVEARMNDNLTMTFKSARNNCKYLRDLVAGRLSDMAKGR